MEIPRRMQSLPLHKGLPMPFVQYVSDSGIPDFKIFDDQKRRDCLLERWCGICGQPLDSLCAFIGGEGSIASHLFSDPPMHDECARYAAATCPYLCRSDGGYSSADHQQVHPEMKIQVLHVAQKRPKRMGLAYTRRYKLVQTASAMYVKAGKWVRIDWLIMPEST